MSTDIRHGRHCVFNLHVHLVFVTKYRKKIFDIEIIRFLKDVFNDVCKKFDVELIECNGEKDHVHLLIFYQPKISISKLVNSLKGASSRRLRNTFQDVTECYYKNVLWSPSYFAASCGGAPINIIKQYIENQ
ncbi:hypothetical protein AB832_06615 [Flavobacteriaceae bacterium (ex Bugula neritina AB1)]|nr:hypothetical protein AB832_06615 [Flavobacteriaceae bacterium (ex Bugula neritina AB1)]